MISKSLALLLTVTSIMLVLQTVDAAKCSQHEILVPIAPNCEKTCNGGCSVRSKRYVICQRPVCICKPGFVRSGGQCVPFNSCKPRTSNPPPCPTTCPPVIVTTTPPAVACPPVTTPCPTTTPAPCPTQAPARPCLVVTRPPCPVVVTRPCGSCGATTPCPCRPIVRVTFS